MNTKWFWVVALVVLAMPYAACTLDNPETPELAGPSELGTSIEMRAVPDTLVSDGFSSSIIEAVVRGPDGQRRAGVTVNFDITRDGTSFLDLGNLAPVNGARPTAGGVEAGPVSAVSGGEGVARVRYWAPFRTDQENDVIVSVTGREASVNFSNQRIPRTVQIFLRAANRPSFPGSAECGFIVEPNKPFFAKNEPVAFTATQLIGDSGTDGCDGNEIARYEWNLESETGGNIFKAGREIVNSWSADGTYTVELVTTEAVTGCQEICSAPVVVATP